jgi:pheromone a factor receptor
MALACVEMMCTTPLAIFLLVINVTAAPLEPWISWQDTHSNFSRVDMVPSVLWRLNNRAAIGFEFTRWSSPACAIIFFLFFGFAAEARRSYSSASNTILRMLHLGREDAFPATTKHGSASKSVSRHFRLF